METRDLLTMLPLLAACNSSKGVCTDTAGMQEVGLFVQDISTSVEDELTSYEVTAVPSAFYPDQTPQCKITPEQGQSWDADVQKVNPEGAPIELIITAKIDHSKVDSANLWCFTDDPCSYSEWYINNSDGGHDTDSFLSLSQ